MKNGRLLALFVALNLTAPPAAAVSPVLSARPSASASGLSSGRTTMSNGAIAYLPASAAEGPLPLVVLLHGAGGRADRFLDRFVAEAD